MFLDVRVLSVPGVYHHDIQSGHCGNHVICLETHAPGIFEAAELARRAARCARSRFIARRSRPRLLTATRRRCMVLCMFSVRPRLGVSFQYLFRGWSDPYQKIGFGDGQNTYENLWFLMIRAIFLIKT